METFETIEKRRSITKYLDIPVEWEKVGNILRAGQLAPSSGNLQDWRFIVVTDKEKRSKIAEACLKQFWMEKAPVHIVICSLPEKTTRFYGLRGEKLYTIQNSAAAVQNMLLAATDQGLGSHWVGAFDEAMLARELGIPKDARPQAIITIGYTDFMPPTPARFKLFDLVYLQRWGNKTENAAIVLGDWSEVIQKKLTAVKQGIEEKTAGKGEAAGAKAKDTLKKLGSKIKEKLKKKPEVDENQVFHKMEE